MKYNHFVFLHIMKTAGMSLRKEFVRVYGKDVLIDRSYRKDRNQKVGLLRVSEKSETIYPENYNKYKIIHGHFTIEKYKHLGWPIFTFLRDPIQRVISHYSMTLIFKNNPLSFEDFCKTTENTMTYMTGGDLDKFSFIGIVEKYEDSLRKLNQILNTNIRLVQENKTPKKVNFGENEINLIKKYNEQDLVLYEKGCQLFERIL